MIEHMTNPDLKIEYQFQEDFSMEDVLFFDIETTGFSVKTTRLYLIGCMYCRNNQWTCRQWFAEQIEDEPKLLSSFFTLLREFKVLVHFNGLGFDIPYILNKCSTYNLDYHFKDVRQVDIYKLIRPLKHILKLENLKLKTIEDFLEIERIDTYQGKELINIYFEYLKAPSTDVLKTLLTHNHDDLTGMSGILPILQYSDLFSGKFCDAHFEIVNFDFIIKLAFAFEIPKRISYSCKNLYVTAHKNTLKINIPIYSGELKFFYRNYKDYYYLPIEDTAIHKSVAFYVDKEFRTKAKAANCYSKKTGRFLPQFSELFQPFFKIEFFDKFSYFECTDERLYDEQFLETYAIHILKYISTQKS